MFRDRWGCGHIGTVIFAVQAALLVPCIIGVMGGGTALSAITAGPSRFLAWRRHRRRSRHELRVLRRHARAAWVNAFQAAVPVVWRDRARGIGRGMGGFPAAIQALLASPDTAPLLTRERFSPLFFLSYTFIPLSTIAFPHITISA